VRVLLDAAIDSPIDLLLRADNCTSIARLRQLIKIPGLLERAEQHGLNTDQYDDLRAIESYINWTYNNGHSDITTQTRGSFDHFFDRVYDVNNPIIANKEAEDNVHDTRTVSAPVIEHTVSLIQALRSPKITAKMASQLHRTDIRRILSERDIPPHMTTSVLPKEEVDVSHPGDIRRVLWQPAKNTRLLSKDDDDDDLHPADICRVLSQPAKMPKPREMTDDRLEAMREPPLGWLPQPTGTSMKPVGQAWWVVHSGSRALTRGDSTCSASFVGVRVRGI
jgi:hypothetical protein